MDRKILFLRVSPFLLQHTLVSVTEAQALPFLILFSNSPNKSFEIIPMEEQREESEFVGDCSEPMEEAGNGKNLSSKTETLIGEDVNTVEGSDEEQVKVVVGSVEDTVGEEKSGVLDAKDRVEKTINSTDVDTGTVEVKLVDDVEVEMNDDETAKSQGKSDNGTSHGSVGDEETVASAGNEVTGEKGTCEVEDNGVACDAGQNAQTEETQQSLVDSEMLSGAEDKADQEKEATNETAIKQDKEEKEKEVTNQGKLGTVSEVVSSAAEINDEEGITNVNQKEENGEAMEIDYAAEEEVEKDGKVGGALDNACNESAGASVVHIQDVPTTEAGVNDSTVVNEMEIDERKDNVDMANPNSPTEDAATGEVEPVDDNALFDPSSDITNFIDFSGVSSWSGNVQDLKTETKNVSLKEDTKATDMAEEVATVGIENKSNEARVTLESESPAAATDGTKEASDANLGSENNQEDKDLECLAKTKADQQDTMREDNDNTHEAPSTEPNQKEDTEMEENPNNSDYADEEAGSDIKTNGVKRKADVLSEDSPGEGRKTVSLAKVSFAQRPSFKIGACIARAASQMAGSPSVLKGSNFGDETLSVESFVSQLHCAATDPVKEDVVSEIAAGFFLDFRNSLASQQVTPEKVSNKRGRPSNSNVGGTEAFEFEEMGDTYWTDRVIHNGGEEQTPATEKEDYQVVPVELKPVQAQRTRRPYRRRQSQISIPLPASDKPANFDENAPAELIMKFSEADTIPPEKSLSKMFRHFGPIRESQTEVDKENNRARVVYRKGTDAEVAYNSAGRFSIFGTKAVNYELSYTITETFKVRPYVVSLGEEDASLCLTS